MTLAPPMPKTILSKKTVRIRLTVSQAEGLVLNFKAPGLQNL